MREKENGGPGFHNFPYKQLRVSGKGDPGQVYMQTNR